MPVNQHRPVLEGEVLNALMVSDDSVIVDATYGRGGHMCAIMAKLGRRGRIVVLDKDPQAIEHAKTNWAHDFRVEIIHTSFCKLTQILAKFGLNGRVSGILIDLGVSSPQLDQSSRGFSFRADGPLDMRMDSSHGQTAAQWLDGIEEKELAQTIRNFGEERFSYRIARHIIAAQQTGKIQTTGELAQVVSNAVPRREIGKHPATRTFQAIRIAINNELVELDQVLPQAVKALAMEGRLVIISFHSLEDGRVKRFFRAQAKGDSFPPDLPVTADQLRPVLRLVGKPKRATEQEVVLNRRARSAVMRVAEKI